MIGTGRLAAQLWLTITRARNAGIQRAPAFPTVRTALYVRLPTCKGLPFCTGLVFSADAG
jgi:hypothetical protein